jgi:hypothetical protein
MTSWWSKSWIWYHEKRLKGESRYVTCVGKLQSNKQPTQVPRNHRVPNGSNGLWSRIYSDNSRVCFQKSTIDINRDYRFNTQCSPPAKNTKSCKPIWHDAVKSENKVSFSSRGGSLISLARFLHLGISQCFILRRGYIQQPTFHPSWTWPSTKLIS